MKIYPPLVIAAIVQPALAVGSLIATYNVMTAKAETCSIETIQPLAWHQGRRSLNVELSRCYQDAIAPR
jgi:hypothetical protein